MSWLHGLWLAALLVILCLGCRSGGSLGTSGVAGASVALEYFPPNTPEPVQEMYTELLRRMGEPVLFNRQHQAPEIYRVTATSACWPCGPAVVRIEQVGGVARMTAKRLAMGRDGSVRGIEKATSRHLRRTEWELFKRYLDEAGFWAMAENDPPDRDAAGNVVVNLDGVSFAMEGVLGDRYRLVERFQDGDYPAFEQACRCLMRWSGMTRYGPTSRPWREAERRACTPVLERR